MSKKSSIKVVAVVSLIAVLLGIFAIQFKEFSSRFDVGAAGPPVVGRVFDDKNGNGVQNNISGLNPNEPQELGLGGITARIFDANENLCDTQISNVTGDYSLDVSAVGCIGTAFRLEFTTLPTNYYPTRAGTLDNTITRFVNSGSTANLGITSTVTTTPNTAPILVPAYTLGDNLDISAATFPTLYSVDSSFLADKDGNINGTTSGNTLFAPPNIPVY